MIMFNMLNDSLIKVIQKFIVKYHLHTQIHVRITYSMIIAFNQIFQKIKFNILKIYKKVLFVWQLWIEMVKYWFQGDQST